MEAAHTNTHTHTSQPPAACCQELAAVDWGGGAEWLVLFSISLGPHRGLASMSWDIFFIVLQTAPVLTHQNLPLKTRIG